MADSDLISDEIEDNATGPKSMTIGGESVSAHSISDQIEADMYLRAKAARKKKRLGLSLHQLKAPGSL